MSSDLAAAMVRSLFCGMRPGEKRLAVFVAYSDETEVFGPEDNFLMGGFVSNETDWPWVAKAWQERVLDGTPNIPYLHMREIKNEKWRNEHRITLRESEIRISEAAEVVGAFGNIAAIVSSVRRSDFNAVFNRKNRKKRHIPIGLNEPDYLCFVAYAAFMLGQVHRKWPEATKVNFVVSLKHGVSNHIKEFKEAMRDQLDEDLRNLLGDVFPASMDTMLPLQAADVLMWHIQRCFSMGMDQRKMEPCDGGRLGKLLQHGDTDGTIHKWERAELEQMAERWTKSGLMT
jgi:hypothetical protein